MGRLSTMINDVNTSSSESREREKKIVFRKYVKCDKSKEMRTR